MDLSTAIKIIRQKSFLTQEQFANELNVAFSTVNRWEKGKTIPNLAAMKQIKEYCERNNLSFEELEDAWLGKTEEREK
jgi:DNA-binding transcriptional regulator YiaG